MEACPFCIANGEGLFRVVRDRFPVTVGHALVVPNRHVARLADLCAAELAALLPLVIRVQEELRKDDPRITGFNVGVNEGKSAGQTVWHLHVHVIPRRDGDLEDPRGGVRGVIPDKRLY